MNWLSLRNNQLNFKSLGKLLVVLEKSIKYTLTTWRKIERSQHVTCWVQKHQDFDQLCPKSPWTASNTQWTSLCAVCNLEAHYRTRAEIGYCFSWNGNLCTSLQDLHAKMKPRAILGQRQSTWGNCPLVKFKSSREEISKLEIESPTSSLRFGYLSTIIVYVWQSFCKFFSFDMQKLAQK